jgi:hypothetical protein
MKYILRFIWTNCVKENKTRFTLYWPVRIGQTVEHNIIIKFNLLHLLKLYTAKQNKFSLEEWRLLG